MKIGYKCLDPVHRELVAELAAEWDLEIEYLEPRDDAPCFPDCMLVDLDAWPAKWESPATPAARSSLLAVHGYSLEDDALEDFAARGIIAAHRLDRDLLLRIYLSVLDRQRQVAQQAG